MPKYILHSVPELCKCHHFIISSKQTLVWNFIIISTWMHPCNIRYQCLWCVDASAPSYFMPLFCWAVQHSKAPSPHLGKSPSLQTLINTGSGVACNTESWEMDEKTGVGWSWHLGRVGYHQVLNSSGSKRRGYKAPCVDAAVTEGWVHTVARDNLQEGHRWGRDRKRLCMRVKEETDLQTWTRLGYCNTWVNAFSCSSRKGEMSSQALTYERWHNVTLLSATRGSEVRGIT